MSVAADPRLGALARAHPYPLVFATLSGAHLYGFPSPDSDFDLRGVHVLPWHEIAGLDVGPQTIARKVGGAEKGTMADADVAFHAAEVTRLCGVLEEAARASPLPDAPSARPGLHDFLLRVRGTALRG